MYLIRGYGMRSYFLLSLMDSAVLGCFLFIGLYLFVCKGMRTAGEEIRKRALQQETVAGLGQLALIGTPLADLLDESVKKAAAVLNVEYCMVLELTADGRRFLMRSGVGWKEGLVGSSMVDAGRQSQAGYTLLSGGPVIVKELKKEDRFTGPKLLVEHGVVSGMSVVIGNRERPFGVLGAHTSRRREFSRDDVNFLLAVSNVLAGAIERRRSEEEIIQGRRDWEDTFDSITDMVTIHDSDMNIIRANKAAGKILGLPPLEKTDGVKCFTFYHGAAGVPEGCLSCSALRSGEPGEFETFEPHLNMFIEVRTIPRFGRKGRLNGLIHIVRDITERKKSEEFIRRQCEHMTALRSIDLAISSSLDLKVTLHVLLEQITAQLKLDAADVLLLDAQAATLNFAAGRGFRTAGVEKTHLALEQGFAGQAVMENRMIRIPDLAPDGKAITEAFREDGFRAYFAVPLTAKGQVKGVLELFHRAPFEPDADWISFLDLLGGHMAIAVDNISMFNTLQRSNLELMLSYDRMIEGWARALDYRDKETEGHCRRVTNLTVKIARMMGITGNELLNVKRGALLHDIGKLGVPDAILLKPGKLTEEEWTVMKKHTGIAADLLSPIPFMRAALDIPYCHHEKWDGTGYPRGLKGEQIPFAARIFAVVDVWDALRSDRPYRPAWPEEMVTKYIRSLSGRHFDPEVVKVFLETLAESKDKGNPGQAA